MEIKISILGVCFECRLTRKARNTKEINKFIDENDFNEFTAPLSEIETPIYSNIEEIAEQFKNDLNTSGLYDIPEFDDVPPRRGIEDDVEIITDEYELEVERIMRNER